MYAFPTGFMVYMMYAFLNSSFYIRRMKLVNQKIYSAPFYSSRIRDDTHMASMTVVQFSRSLNPLYSYVQNSSTPLTLDVQSQINARPPSTNDNQTIKRKHNQGMTLNIIRSFLHVSFCFQFQLINLVWFSTDFFQFSWSQPCPQSYF